MERFFTDQCINGSDNDAASLVISYQMMSQIDGLQMTARNMNDSICIVTEGNRTYAGVTNMLQKVRELTV